MLHTPPALSAPPNISPRQQAGFGAWERYWPGLIPPHTFLQLGGPSQIYFSPNWGKDLALRTIKFFLRAQNSWGAVSSAPPKMLKTQPSAGTTFLFVWFKYISERTEDTRRSKTWPLMSLSSSRQVFTLLRLLLHSPFSTFRGGWWSSFFSLKSSFSASNGSWSVRLLTFLLWWCGGSTIVRLRQLHSSGPWLLLCIPYQRFW